MNSSCENEMSKIYFKKVTNLHKKTILNWFSKAHVKKYYYGQGLQNTLHNIELYCQGINNNGHYTFDHWIAFYDKIPFGFLMTSPITGPYNQTNDYNKWYVEGKQTFTLDLLIGPLEFLGKGLSHKMIQALILNQFSDADYFIIDPAKDNLKAIHVYEKAGFKKIDEFFPSFDPIKCHIMMRMAVKDLNR